MKKILFVAAAVLLLAAGCSAKKPVEPVGSLVPYDDTPQTVPSSTPSSTASSSTVTGAVVYKNAQFGFSVTLPESWKGFGTVTSTWEGNPLLPNGAKVTGTTISIRHPLYTAQVPRQDIPVMVFPVAAWNSMVAEDFHIGAAPINPSELARNSKYVFALPARYNFAFPAGYEEVDKIIASKAVVGFEQTISGTPVVPPVQSAPAGQITLSGMQECLPHKDTGGMQTMECAFGLKTDDGKHYALNFGASAEAMASFSAGKRLTATGTFAPVETLSASQWQKYPIEGIFTVITRK